MITRKNEQNLSCNELRKLFVFRFGVRLVSSITEFAHLRYDPSKGILDYHKNKRRLGASAELSEEHIISLMIDGRPSSLSSALFLLFPRSIS